MAQPITVSPEALAERVSRIFLAAGLSPLQAETLAATIVAGERDACKSHGIYRIEGCLRTVAAGKVQPQAEPELQDDGSPVVRVDAKGAFSTAAFAVGLATRPIAETARDTLDWLRSAKDPTRTGLTRAEERDLLDAWHSSRA